MVNRAVTTAELFMIVTQEDNTDFKHATIELTFDIVHIYKQGSLKP